MGFPIRKSTDQSLFAAPHGLSQRITSFIACVCQGIHQMPLFHLIIPIAHDHRVEARSRRRPKGSSSALGADWQSQSDGLAAYGAHILRCPLHKPSAVLHSGVHAPQRERRHDRCPRKPEGSTRRARLGRPCTLIPFEHRKHEGCAIHSCPAAMLFLSVPPV